jgi:hypothetical protein
MKKRQVSAKAQSMMIVPATEQLLKITIGAKWHVSK